MIRFIVALTILSLLFISAEAVYSSFPDNTIPTLAMRLQGSNVSLKGYTIEFLCELSWLNFDAVNFGGEASSDDFVILMSFCDSAGVYYSICPSEIMQYFKAWADPEYRYWFRNSDELLTSESCFARCDTDFVSIEQYTTAESLYFEHETISIRTTIRELAASIIGHDFLWFYEVYDEAPSQQWRHAVRDTVPWNDYLPNVYTQDTLSGDTLSLAEVEASGIFSIQKYYAENDTTNPVTFTLNFGLLHTIEMDEYTGLKGDIPHGTMADQATSVRAMMEAEYQPPPSGDTIHIPEDNTPEFISFDYYPFRYVNPDSALAGSGAATMCDDDWLFLIDHFEEGIDSTVIPTLEENVPVYFYPQTFGVAGGPAMWNATGDTLDYDSYIRRNPSSQEFLMLCNLALLHQAKGIFPYNLCSYMEFDDTGSPSSIVSSLLDSHNIPFDAPYEEWIYTGRWPVDEEEDFEYVRPDSIPPWIDGYDPLFEVEDPPSESDYAKYKEDYFEWLFEPYGILYNDLGDILAEVKRIAPEMFDLWWWEENGTPYWDVAHISVPDSGLVDNYVSPRIRVFYNESNDHAYLFYVNRFCGEYYMGDTDLIPVDISIQGTQLPGSPGNPYLFEDAIDHSRRCLVPIEEGYRDWYFFDDTLAAGESRLLEFVDLSSPIQADLRVTSPDVFCHPTGFFDRNRELRCTAGTNLSLVATFFNMGTDSTGDVKVTFTDHSEASPSVIGADTINLSGLSGDYEPDSTFAVVTWSTDSTDIGVHVIEISADSISGEDYYDNTVWITVLVEPFDYATEVRRDAWDMDYDSTSNWHTGDIEAIAENWNTSTGWTDSVSGMFEGVIEYDSTAAYHFIGDISLAIPDSVSKYIDTEKYHMLSFGITVNNPNTLSDNACGMRIGWRDDHNQWHDYVGLLGDTEYHVGNGWDRWSVIGPIDLKADTSLHWGNDNAKELWIRFQSGQGVAPGSPEPIDVRIGWFRLEESVQ